MHAPLKLVSKRKAKQLSKPWMTKGLLKSTKIKNKLFYSGNTDRYKLYRNNILKLTRMSRKNYYTTLFSNNFTNMKKTWEGINNLINCKKKKNRRPIISLKNPNNGRLVHDPAELSNIINNYFASIGPN